MLHTVQGKVAPLPLGWFPALSLVGAVGLLFVAVADTGARVAAGWAAGLFWVGLLLLFCPVALHLFALQAARYERLGLVALLGSGLYLVKVLHSPTEFTFADEYLHWRTAQDVLGSGVLFQINPMHPVTPLYAGLANVTTALCHLSGMSIFASGIVVIGVARLVLMLMLYLFCEEISQSAWMAGVATLLYMVNANYLFFSAQFAYESLASPLAMLVVFVLVFRQRLADPGRLGMNLVVLLGIGAVVVTHHVTSYIFVSFLGLWLLVTWLRTKGSSDRAADLSTTTLLALVISLTWLIYIATLTIGFLAPNLRDALLSILRLLAGEMTSRTLFQVSGSPVPPRWEQWVSVAAVGLTLLALPWGLWCIWQSQRRNPLMLALAVAALGYPLSLVLRLTTPQGAEITNRTWSFLFVAIAPVLALGLERFWLADRQHWMRAGLFTTWATLLFMGGVIIGFPVWGRLPGPYLVGADMRSIEPQSVRAAEWMRVVPGPNNRVIADRTNRMLLGSYGEQYPVMQFGDKLPTWQVIMSPALGPAERSMLQQGAIRYVLVDRRLATGLPLVGFYFEKSEPNVFQYTVPLDAAALQKFDHQEQVNRIFDSGDIRIYDVGAVSGAR